MNFNYKFSLRHGIKPAYSHQRDASSKLEISRTSANGILALHGGRLLNVVYKSLSSLEFLGNSHFVGYLPRTNLLFNATWPEIASVSLFHCQFHCNNREGFLFSFQGIDFIFDFLLSFPSSPFLLAFLAQGMKPL